MDFRPLRVGVFLLCALLLVLSAAQAATNIWSTTPANGNWNNNANWGGSAPSPGNSTVLQFSNSTVTALTNNFSANSTFNGFHFTAGASAYTITGNAIKLDAAGSTTSTIINSSANLQTINLAMALSKALSITSTNGGGNIQLGGVISGGQNLIVAGNGTTTLTAANTYSGTTTVNTGVLQIGNGGAGEAIGTGNIILTNNGSLILNHNDNLSLANLISGTGNLIVTGGFGSAGWNNGSGWNTLSGNNTFSGTITVNTGVLQATSDTQFGNATNNIILNGGELFNNGSMLTINANRTITLTTNGGNLDGGWGQYPAYNNGITVLGSITGDGGTNGLSISWDWGGVVLAGSNNYTGPTTIGGTNSAYWYNSGSAYTTALVLSNANALPTGSQLNFSAAPTNVNSADAYTAQLSLNGYNASVGGISGGANAVITNTASGAVTLTMAPANSSSFAGTIGQSGGAVSLVMNGSGTQSLLASNSYSGGTTLNAGTLAISNNAALGTGAVSFASNSTLASLASLSVTNNFNIASNATATIDVATNNNLNASGVILGAGALTKIDTGTLTLSGTNTYTGTTTIATNGGVLSLSTTGKLASTNIVVNSGGTLLFGGNNQITTNSNLTLNGGTVSTGGGTTARAGTNSFNTLTLTANSTIDFSQLTGNTALNFNSILGLGTYTLTILDWSGTMNNGVVIGGGTTTGLFDYSSLSATELMHINFYSGPNTSSGFLGTGTFNGRQIVPVPEPAVIMAAALLLSFLAYSQVTRSSKGKRGIFCGCGSLRFVQGLLQSVGQEKALNYIGVQY